MYKYFLLIFFHFLFFSAISRRIFYVFLNQRISHIPPPSCFSPLLSHFLNLLPLALQLLAPKHQGNAKYNLAIIAKENLEIIQGVAKGLSNREIAEALFLSEGTVRNYLNTILNK